MTHELRLFLTACQFFTRLPVPAWVGWSPQQLNASARYFPAVGALVGAFQAAVLWAALRAWPAGIAVGLALLAGVLLTGAFHEDGLADSCDGLGGGDGVERVLAIMKDSRVGSYAVIGLLLVLGLKWQLLCAATQSQTALSLALALVSGHALSRFVVLILMARLPYLREDAQAKSKPIAQGMAAGPLAFAAGVALLPWLALGAVDGLARTWWAAGLAPLLVAVLATRYLRQRLGGYVGDVLGATQQLAELVFWLAWMAGRA
jgi:adenosylcobinamide-GDP ribazoletransferase